MLGTPIETIIDTEDRELFSEKLRGINETLALSYSATTMDEALAVADKVSTSAYALREISCLSLPGCRFCKWLDWIPRAGASDLCSWWTG